MPDIKRTNKVSVFFTDSEFLAISREATLEDRSTADLVRRRVLLSMYGSMGLRNAEAQKNSLLADDSGSTQTSGWGQL